MAFSKNLTIRKHTTFKAGNETIPCVTVSGAGVTVKAWLDLLNSLKRVGGASEESRKSVFG